MPGLSAFRVISLSRIGVADACGNAMAEIYVA
jgi:hypothetical protein